MGKSNEIVKIDITVERTVRICKEFEATKEQLEELRNGINPFLDEFESDLLSGDGEYDYSVNDTEGRTLVDWN